MKNAFFRMTGMLALAFLAAAQVARAQQPMVVNVPFAFTAGEMTLPAGEYRVQEVKEGSPVLLIQSTDQGRGTFVMARVTSTIDRQKQSKLVFRRYGDRYFLSQVWKAGYQQGRELPKLATEKEEALLARNRAPEQVTIIARLTPAHQ